MTTNSGQVLGVMLRDLGRVEGAVGAVNSGLGKMKLLAVGALGALAGGAALRGLWGMVAATRELNHELEKLRQVAHLTPAGVQGARDLAFQTGIRVPGTRVEQNVQLQRELFSVLNDMKEVQAVMPDFARANRALSLFTDTHTDLAQVGMRALELRGKISADGHVDPALLRGELEAMTKAIIASGGMLNVKDFLGVMQQAGPAATSMSQDAFWGQMTAAMVAMGSHRSGTALMSLFQQLAGGVMSQRAAQELEKLGIIDPKHVQVRRGGQIVMDPKAMPTLAAFMNNPFSWVHDVLVPKLQKSKDPVAEMQSLFRLSSRQTSARLLNDIMRNWFMFQNEYTRYRNAPSAEQALKDFNEKDLTANLQNFQAAWSNFIQAMGEQGVPLAISVLQNLTSALNKMTEWAANNPAAARGLMELSAGIAALLAVSGGLLVISTAFRVLVSPITALAGAASLFGEGAAAAGGLTFLAGALSRLAGPLAFLYGMKPSSTQTQEQENKQLGGPMHERFPNLIVPKDVPLGPREPGDFNFGDRNERSIFGPQSYAPPPRSSSGGQSGPLPVYVTNGRDIADGTAAHIGKELSRPQSGPTGPDPRVNIFPIPVMP